MSTTLVTGEFKRGFAPLRENISPSLKLREGD
jgi:hypothetical protein